MIWILGILGAIVLLTVLSNLSNAAKKVEEAQKVSAQNELIKSRTEAYADFLRRTSEDSELKKMSDNELREHVQTNIRGFHKAKDNVFTLGAVILFAFMALGAVVGIADQDWIIAIFFGGMGLIFGLAATFIGQKKVRQRYIDMGFDIEKLEIE